MEYVYVTPPSQLGSMQTYVLFFSMDQITMTPSQFLFAGSVECPLREWGESPPGDEGQALDAACIQSLVLVKGWALFPSRSRLVTPLEEEGKTFLLHWISFGAPSFDNRPLC